jgi:hypothetical protein
VPAPFKRYLLFAVVSLAARALSFAIEVIDVDEAVHAVGSWVAWSGGLLYTDFVDNKPPLLYVYYGAAQALLGVGLVPVRVFTALLTVPLTALAASAFFHHDRRGLVAGLLYVVFGAAFIGHDVLAANTEVLLLLPAAWAVVVVRDEGSARRSGRLLAAGALLGVASLLKIHALSWLPALGWAAWRAQRAQPGPAGPGVGLVALAAGFLTPSVAAWVYFASRGGEAPFVYWTLVTNAVYSANAVPPREWLGRAAASVLPFLLVTAPLVWLWLRAPREPADAYRFRLVAALVVVSLLAVAWGLRFFPHYFVPVYWPLALAAGPAAASLTLPLQRAGAWLLVYTAAVWLGFTASTAVLYVGGWQKRRVYWETDPVYRRLAEHLQRDVCAHGATLFVWGYAPIVYYEARMPPASRFVALSQSGLTGYVSGNRASLEARGPHAPGIVQHHWDLLLADLERSRATFIVDTAPAGIFRWDRFPLSDFPRLAAYVAAHYEDAGSVDRVRVYRRRGCSGPGALREGRRPWPPFTSLRPRPSM